MYNYVTKHCLRTLRLNHVSGRTISVLRPEIKDEQTAKIFVTSLSQSEREYLQDALAKEPNNALCPKVLTRGLLAKEALYSGIPFLGFGFLDNTIMLCAGEYIDVTLGSVLGISTLTAAALGNLVSDVAGIGTAGTVERNVKRVLGRSSVLTAEQREHKRAHWWVFGGRCIGICIGCILGMWPLLFYREDEHQPKEAFSQTK